VKFFILLEIQIQFLVTPNYSNLPTTSTNPQSSMYAERGAFVKEYPCQPAAIACGPSGGTFRGGPYIKIEKSSFCKVFGFS
jgi:hypothetical protein